METVVLAGGCFWCTEAIFKRLTGVLKVTSGYANSKIDNPSYEQVCTGATNAAEALKIEFDPKTISLENILEVFFATHDPTTLNQQGADRGTQYRSGVYYSSDSQKKAAEKFKEKVERSGEYTNPIVTEISPLQNFYTAEDYHKDYFDTNPNQPYCSLVIAPKVQKLLAKFSGMVKKEYKQSLKF